MNCGGKLGISVGKIEMAHSEYVKESFNDELINQL